MNIAIVLAGGVDRSGERRVIPVVLALLERLAARHTVHVFALCQEPQPGEWTLRGARIHNIGSLRALHRTLGAIRRANRATPFDLVHALWAGPSALSGALAARLLGIPLLVHLTGGELVGIRHIGYGQRLQWRWRLLNRWILASAACVSATSEPIIALAAGQGIRARRVPLGIDLREWPARQPRSRDVAGPARLIQVGSLNLVKDQFTTLAALRLLRDRGLPVVMDFVGEDTLHGAVEARARALGLEDATHFHGFRTQRELRPLMEGAHLHVVSSLHEAGPAAALEAAIAGVPSVGTNVGHLAEWRGEAARTVAAGDAAALAREIEALLVDDALRLRLAQAQQARAVAEDADFTAREFEAAYTAVMNR